MVTTSRKGNDQEQIQLNSYIVRKTPNGKGTQTLMTAWSKTTQAESQEDRSFPQQNEQIVKD